MTSRSALTLAIAVTALQAGCTFYTACPTGNAATNNPPGGGGSGGQAGSGGGPNGTWVNVTNELAGLSSECGNLANMSAKPDEDMLIAGVATRGLYASTDGGASWHLLGTGAGSDMITNRLGSIVYDPTQPNRFWESGAWHPGGVFVTEDDGDTFTQLGATLQHNDIVSVDFTDPMRSTLLAGGHEQPNTLYKSSDGGSTWQNIGDKIPGSGSCENPLIIDTQNYLVGCYGAEPGIFRSTDAGDSWTMLTQLGGASQALVASDGSIYWSSENYLGSTQWSGLAHSTDQGASWERMGVPGQITSAAPTQLPDGRIAALSLFNVMISADNGVTWTEASSRLPYGDVKGMVYSVQQKAFFVWRWTCNAGADNVPNDAVMRYDFDPAVN